MDWCIGIPAGIALVILGAVWISRGVRWISPSSGISPYYVGFFAGGLVCPLTVFIISVFSDPATVTRSTYGSAIAALVLALLMAVLVIDVNNLSFNRRIETVTVAVGTAVLEYMALVGDMGFAEAQAAAVLLFLFMQFVHRNRKGAVSDFKEDCTPRTGPAGSDMVLCAVLIVSGLAVFISGFFLAVNGGTDLAHAIFGAGGPLESSRGFDSASVSGSLSDNIGPFGYALVAGAVQSLSAAVLTMSMRHVGQKALAAGTLSGTVCFTCLLALVSVMFLDMTLYG